MLIRRVLASPFAYRTHMKLLGGRSIKAAILRRHLNVAPQSNLLDVGCGPAPDRDLLGPVRWTGVDMEEHYVEYVRRHLRANDRVILGDVSTIRTLLGETFEVVLLSGVLHHLDDDKASQLLSDCLDVLSDNGYILTIDPVRIPGKSRLERFLINMDRGEYIRSEKGYYDLVPSKFGSFESHVYPDLGWLPQTQHVAILKK